MICMYTLFIHAHTVPTRACMCMCVCNLGTVYFDSMEILISIRNSSLMIKLMNSAIRSFLYVQDILRNTRIRMYVCIYDRYKETAHLIEGEGGAVRFVCMINVYICGYYVANAMHVCVLWM